MEHLRSTAVLILAVLAIMVGRAQTSEIQLIQNRLVLDAVEEHGFRPRIHQYTNFKFELAADYLDALSEEGSWPDVDYFDRDNSWSPLRALDYIMVIALAYRNPANDLYHRTDVKAGLERALNYWYAVAPTCDNWYKNDIGKQIYLNVIGILLKGHIDEPLIRKITEDLTPSPRMTGSNRTLLSVSVLYRGILEGNLDRIQSAVAGVRDQIVVTDKEGVQSDFSFHQHGAFLYNGSYGHNFLRESLWTAYIVRGTKYAFPEKEIEILRNYFLQGTRWMLWRNTLDYNVRGRHVGRSYSFDPKGENQITLLDKLIKIDPAFAESYRDAKQSILKDQKQNIAGLKHFWRSDYTVNQSSNYFTSLRMCSRRTVGMEMDINSENLLGHYLPFGLTYIYRTGKEYLNIFPVWDWARLPGVTSPHHAFRSEGRSSQATSFVGGVSNGHIGVSTMDLSIDQTEAKKSWFWFDRYWVALGTDIQSTHEYEIVTGVNQVLKNGPIYIDGIALDKDSMTVKASNSIWHDSISYFIDHGGLTYVTGMRQEGQLQDIYGLGADTVYHSDVFSIWLDHGKRPESRQYRYAVMPASSREAASKLPELFSVIENTGQRQVVRDLASNSLGMVFHEAGRFTLGDKDISVSNPILVIWSLDTNKISVADPTGQLEQVSIAWKSSDHAHSQIVVLPTGDQAGRSVNVL